MDVGQQMLHQCAWHATKRSDHLPYDARNSTSCVLLLDAYNPTGLRSGIECVREEWQRHQGTFDNAVYCPSSDTQASAIFLPSSIYSSIVEHFGVLLGLYDIISGKENIP